MQVKRVPVQAQDYDKVVQIDASATHWSLEHSKHAAAALSALSTFQDMVAAKNQVVTELCKSSGMADMSKVVQARIVKTPEGEHFIEMAFHDDEPEAPAAGEPPVEAVPTPAS